MVLVGGVGGGAPEAPWGGVQRRRRRLSRGAAVSLEFKSALLHLTSKSPLELADSGGPGDRPGGPGRPQAAARAPLASCLRFCIKCFCIESNSTLERLIHDTSKIATPRLLIRVRCRPRCPVPQCRQSPAPVRERGGRRRRRCHAHRRCCTRHRWCARAAELAAASRHDRPSSTRRDAARRDCAALVGMPDHAHDTRAE